MGWLGTMVWGEVGWDGRYNGMGEVGWDGRYNGMG